jgi:two-component system, CitB family, response regulator MalR
MIKVIIVEDDPMVSMINHQYLEKRSNFEIYASVGSITELWKELDKEIPDLILLDVFLPGATGIDFLLEVRRKQLSIPIIMITAANDITTIKKALEYGVIDFLIKPFTYKRFSLAIEKFLQYHSLTTRFEETNQGMLDQIFNGGREHSSPIPTVFEDLTESNLPKGLSHLTMKRIVEAVVGKKDNFSTEDIAKLVGLSRISTKKYLKYLNDIGYLTEDLKYLSIGRPIMLFTTNEDKEHLISSYK